MYGVLLAIYCLGVSIPLARGGPLPNPKEDYRSYGQPSQLRNFSEVGVEMMVF